MAKQTKKKQLFPIKYLPLRLKRNDRKTQRKALIKSKSDYKKGKYTKRPKLASYKNKTSKYVLQARKMYNIKKVKPSKELSKKTGCSIRGLNKIVKKGQGAYYSSGSRPNQSGHSWELQDLPVSSLETKQLQ